MWNNNGSAGSHVLTVNTKSTGHNFWFDWLTLGMTFGHHVKPLRSILCQSRIGLRGHKHSWNSLLNPKWERHWVADLSANTSGSGCLPVRVAVSARHPCECLAPSTCTYDPSHCFRMPECYGMFFHISSVHMSNSQIMNTNVPILLGVYRSGKISPSLIWKGLDSAFAGLNRTWFKKDWFECELARAECIDSCEAYSGTVGELPDVEGWVAFFHVATDSVKPEGTMWIQGRD